MSPRRKRARLTRLLVDAAQERFYACEECYKSEAFDPIEDALTPLRLKLRELKRLLQRLTCPRCESRVYSGTLVVTPTTEQLHQTRLSKKFDVLNGIQLKNFREFVINHPMLGAEHPFGRLLSKVMKRAKKTVLEPSVWHRATRYSDMPKFGPRPPHESTRANRYNQIGQAAWYLGSDEKTAAVEVMREPKAGQPVSTAKVKLLEPIVVLDLRSVIWGDDPIRQWILRNVVDSRFISEPTSDIEDTRPEYRIPQFVSDLARRRKFRGILYDSTRPSAYNNPEAAGHNLVVFDPFPAHAIESEKVVEFGEPDYDPFSLERWPLRQQLTRCDTIPALETHL
jgi:hypothetical protein